MFDMKRVNFYFHTDLFRINGTKVEVEIHFFLPSNQRCFVETLFVARFSTDNKFLFTQVNPVKWRIHRTSKNKQKRNDEITWKNRCHCKTWLVCRYWIKKFRDIVTLWQVNKLTWCDFNVLSRTSNAWHGFFLLRQISLWPDTQWSSFHRTKMQISTKYRFHFNQQEEKSAPSCTWTQFHYSLDKKNLIGKEQQREIHSSPTDKIPLLLHCYFRAKKNLNEFFDFSTHCRWISHRIKCFSLFDFFQMDRTIKYENVSSICLSGINIKLHFIQSSFNEMFTR